MSAEFKVYAPLRFFEKSSAPEGRKLRIAGVVSTEKRDRQDEIILQNGLDFSYFKEFGYYNDNHDKGPAHILGYPDGDPKIFKKGTTLPDGNKAKDTCTWAEGYLLDTPRGRATWENGRALAGTDRQIGYSLEGSITGRTGMNNNIATSAVVRNIAITECPVGFDTGMNALVKAMTEAMTEDELAKTLSMSTDAGTGDGEALTPESLEKADDAEEGDDEFDDKGEYVEPTDEDDTDEEEGSNDEISKSEFANHVSAQFPFSGPASIERAVRMFFTPENGKTMTTMSNDQLEKALNDLEGATSTPAASRHQDLLSKAMSGDITPEENVELAKSLSGNAFGLASEVSAVLNPSDEMNKALNVSDMLTEQNDNLTDAMGLIADRMEKSEAMDQGFRVALAVTMNTMGELLKSMNARIDTIGSAPSGMVKSQVARSNAIAPLERPVGGEEPQRARMSKAQVCDAITEIGRASPAWKSPTGEDYSVALSSYEHNGELSKSMQAEVMGYFKKQKELSA